MRVLILLIPDFAFRAHEGPDGPLEALDPEQRRRAVLVEGDGARAKVVAPAPELRAEGVHSGMTVASTRSRAGAVWALGYERARVEREAARMAGLLLQASPQVHVGGPGVFWVGAEGCRFLGGETALVHLVGELVRQAGHPDPARGLADSIIAARAAALHGIGIVPPGGDRKALDPLPLAVLPLEPPTLKALSTLGIRTVGAFAILPASQIAARFGPDAITSHRLARGEDHRTVPVLAATESPRIEVDFDTPHDSAEPALFVIQGGMERLIAPHRARGFGVQCLRLELLLRGGQWVREIRPADPVIYAPRLIEMCQALLMDAELPGVMEGIRVEVVEVAPARGRQEGLWEARRQRTVSLESLLTRLQGRGGPHAVKQPEPPRDAHLPEDMAAWAPIRLGPTPKPKPGTKSAAAEAGFAAWRLKLPPRQLNVEMDEGVPSRAELDGRWSDVLHLVGPQRIETGWFRTEKPGPRAASAASIRRDYWFAELSDGTALSLYQDLGSSRWFLQGVMD